MRSYDQFSNIVLEDTHERHFVGGEHAVGWWFVSHLCFCVVSERGYDAAYQLF